MYSFMKQHIKKKMWEITEHIKYKEEVKAILESMTERIIEVCDKFETGNCNTATLPAFFLGVQGDIDEGLKKCRRSGTSVKQEKK